MKNDNRLYEPYNSPDDNYNAPDGCSCGCGCAFVIIILIIGCIISVI